MPDDQPDAAVDRANRAIRTLLASLPADPDNWTARQHKRYDQLLAAWGQAVRQRGAGREGDDAEGEPVAA